MLEGPDERRATGEADSRSPFVYVVEEDLSVDDGAGINERELIDQLTRRHPDRVICVAPYPRHPERHYNPAIRYVRPHGGKVVPYGRFLLSTFGTLREIHRQRRPVAFVFRLGASPVVPYLVMKLLGAPIIIKKLSLYSIFGGTVLRGRIKNAVSRSFFPMYRAVIRGALGADVESPTYVHWLKERFGIPEQRMHVIRNGANTELFQPMDRERTKRRLGLAEFDLIVGYVGALSRLRFVDALIRSVGLLKLGERVGLVIVGAGSERDLLEGVAREEGLADRVRFVGPVPYVSVPEYTACFDVAADLTAVQMQVGSEMMLASFSQKIAQYLASGAPVLAWDSLDTEFLAESGIGRLAPFGDEAGMAAAMTELLAVSAEERAATSQRARRIAEKDLSAEAVADRRVRLWESLTGR